MLFFINFLLKKNEKMKKDLYQDIKAYFFELTSNPIYFKKLFRYELVSKATLIQSMNSFTSKSMSLN